MTPPAPDTLVLPVSTAVHSYRAIAAGGPGECGASCICGVTFDGFDTLREALALLDGHIADGQSIAAVPTLAELVLDAERLAGQLVTALSRQYDPASAPGDPSEIDADLSYAASLAQGALTRLWEAAKAIAEIGAPE